MSPSRRGRGLRRRPGYTSHACSIDLDIDEISVLDGVSRPAVADSLAAKVTLTLFSRSQLGPISAARWRKPNGPHQLRDGASDSRSPEGAFASQPSQNGAPISHVSCM
jgi:hypothetical protein